MRLQLKKVHLDKEKAGKQYFKKFPDDVSIDVKFMNKEQGERYVQKMIGIVLWCYNILFIIVHSPY